MALKRSKKKIKSSSRISKSKINQNNWYCSLTYIALTYCCLPLIKPKFFLGKIKVVLKLIIELQQLYRDILFTQSETSIECLTASYILNTDLLAFAALSCQNKSPIIAVI